MNKNDNDNDRAKQLFQKWNQFCLQPSEDKALTDEEFKFLYQHTRKLIDMLDAYPDTRIVSSHFWRQYLEFQNILLARGIQVYELNSSISE